MVICTWSDVEQDRNGDEFLQHYVGPCDDELEPIGTFFRCATREQALELGAVLAKRQATELIDETIRN